MCICSTTTTEASEKQAKLQEQTTKVLQSNHEHSVLLRELISRQEEQVQALGNIRSTLASSDIRDRSNTSTLGGTDSSTVPTRPSSAGSQPSAYRENPDNASIMSKRSTFSLRLGRPDYLEDLKESRAYKRLRHFGRGIDSTAESVFSSDSGCSTGNWSILSEITLGDLSVSEIAVLNLPIDLSDVSNPEPFQDRLSRETPRNPAKPRTKRSSRGRIHNAVETGNVFVIRALLAMGMDIEELDSRGRTPLVHAIMKRQEAICKLSLEKGASASGEALNVFASGMDLPQRPELLDLLISKAMDNGSATVLKLLVKMALGTNYGEDDNRSSSQSMMNIAIDMNYDVAVHAIIHLEPRVLVEVDTEGRTPLVYATIERREAICKLLLEKGASLEPLQAFTSRMDLNGRSNLLDSLINKAMDNGSATVLRLLVKMALGTNYGGCDTGSSSQINVAIDMNNWLVARTIIHPELGVLVEVDTEGRTPFAYAYHVRRNKICEKLLEYLTLEAAATDVMAMELGIRLVEDAHDAIVFDHPKTLELVIVVDASIEELYTEKYGQTLVVAAFSVHRPKICEMLLNSTKGTITTATKNLYLEGDLAGHFRFAIEGNCPRVLDLLLARGVDVGKIDIEGQTPLAHAAEAVRNSEDNNYESWNCICKALLDKASRANIDTVKKIQPNPRAQYIAASMHDLVEKDYRSILVLLSVMESRDPEGCTPLASAAFHLKEALCEYLVGMGCRLCLDTEQKKQLKPN